MAPNGLARLLVLGRVALQNALRDLRGVAVEEHAPRAGVRADLLQGVEVLVQHEQVHDVLAGSAVHRVREVHDTVPVKVKGRNGVVST
jgi:hypothetical protein